MKRVIAPLREIGASIYAREQNSLAPISIIGSQLRGFHYKSPISSAQVKSAMILAGIYADSVCYFSEPSLSRDHTERMLESMGMSFQKTECGIYFEPLPRDKRLESFSITVPSDPSSAFYFAVAACVVGGEVLLKNVLLNPTRIQAFKILESMGAKIIYHHRNSQYEDIGDIEVKGSSRLKPVCVLSLIHI